MKKITLVTGSKHKLKEWQRVINDRIELDSVSLDLEEIQSMDPLEITERKVRQAYELVQKPVVMEDVSCGLASWGGLPGPFNKYFQEVLGRDALHQITKDPDDIANALCTIGYFDGKKFFMCEGTVTGRVVAMTSDAGFGFDAVLAPDGYDETLSELGPKVKDKVGHRGKAIEQLLLKLAKLPD
jgi:inosine triphosphate pyrophosphatase